MGIVTSNNKRLSLTCPCPTCKNTAVVVVKGSIEVDVISTSKCGVNMVDSFIQSNFACPICGSKMRIYRDAINRIVDIIEKVVSGLVVKTYTHPKFNGVTVVNEMLVDDYTYPSLVIIHEDNEIWKHEICELIDTIAHGEAFGDRLEIHRDDPMHVRGAIFIKLNKEKFNNYFIEAKAPMHTFVTVAEEYFFDLIDLLANELENVYNFDHKDEK